MGRTEKSKGDDRSVVAEGARGWDSSGGQTM